MQFHHLNHLWAYLIICSLKQAGVQHICIAPGSRSTPLTLAAASSGIKCHLHFDERGLGFMALGLAKKSQTPVAIITTSGTAVANLYPAIIEASLTQIPLIILSADRPEALINCGANQAIEQQGIFAAYPVYQANLSAPNADSGITDLLTQLQNLIKHSRQGPVHLNCMFDEPLYPTGEALDFSAYLADALEAMHTYQASTDLTKPCLRHPNWRVLSQQKGIVIVGKMHSVSQAKLIADFAKKLNWPVFADLQSQLAGHPLSIKHYDLLLKSDDIKTILNQAKLVIQFGARLISKRLLEFIEHFEGDYWQIDPAPIPLDPLKKAERYYAAIPQWLEAHSVINAIDKKWLANIKLIQSQMTMLIKQELEPQKLSELSLAHILPTLLPNNSTFFIGNSMPVRLLDMLHSSINNKIHYLTNRGASGIDGLLATAIGVAKAKPQQITTLLIGDLSLLHDLSSLALTKQVNNLIIILINNDGGSIFKLLPVPKQVQRDYYQLPHNTDFLASCQQFALHHQQPSNLAEFTACYHQALLRTSASLIEVTVANGESHELLTQLSQRINEHTF